MHQHCHHEIYLKFDLKFCMYKRVMFGNSERETSAARPTAEVTYALHEYIHRYIYIFYKMVYRISG